MTNEMLAQYANYALASAALLVTVAMLGYALYLAQAVPVREPADAEARVPAAVGGPTDEGGTVAADPAPPVETTGHPLAFADEVVVVHDTVEGPAPRQVTDASDRFWDVLTWRLADDR